MEKSGEVAPPVTTPESLRPRPVVEFSAGGLGERMAPGSKDSFFAISRNKEPQIHFSGDVRPLPPPESLQPIPEPVSPRETEAIAKGQELLKKGVDSVFVLSSGQQDEGSVASRAAVEAVISTLAQSKTSYDGLPIEQVKSKLAEAVQVANTAVLAESKENEDGNKDRGASLALAITIGKNLYCAKVGWAKVYSFTPKGETLELVTPSGSNFDFLGESDKLEPTVSDPIEVSDRTKLVLAPAWFLVGNTRHDAVTVLKQDRSTNELRQGLINKSKNTSKELASAVVVDINSGERPQDEVAKAEAKPTYPEPTTPPESLVSPEPTTSPETLQSKRGLRERLSNWLHRFADPKVYGWGIGSIWTSGIYVSTATALGREGATVAALAGSLVPGIGGLAGSLIMEGARKLTPEGPAKEQTKGISRFLTGLSEGALATAAAYAGVHAMESINAFGQATGQTIVTATETSLVDLKDLVGKGAVEVGPKIPGVLPPSGLEMVSYTVKSGDTISQILKTQSGLAGIDLYRAIPEMVRTNIGTLKPEDLAHGQGQAVEAMERVAEWASRHKTGDPMGPAIWEDVKAASHFIWPKEILNIPKFR